MIKAIIFDLDGTLTDTLDDLANAVNFILEKHGYPLRSRDEIRSFVGNGLKNLLKRSLPTEIDAVLLSELTKEFTSFYDSHNLILTKPYEGVVEMLRLFRQEGIACAVATNKRESAAIDICDHFFPDLLVSVKGDNGIRPMKPHPAIIDELLQVLNVSKEETLYIGDSETDAYTAMNAGLKSVGVLWGFRTQKQLEAVGMTDFAEKCDDIHSHVKKYG